MLKMAEPITNKLVHLEREGTEVYDAHLQCNVLVVAPVLCAICRGREPGGAGGAQAPPLFDKGGLSPPKIWLSMGQMKNIKFQN